MDWITDQIAIGNFLDAQSLPEEIDAVLCLREACCEDRSDIDALCIPFIDGPGNDPRDLEEALAFIEEVVTAGQRILVHCHAGRSRSVVIVARHLMRSRGLTAQAALDLISARREIYLSPGIEDLLSAAEARIPRIPPHFLWHSTPTSSPSSRRSRNANPSGAFSPRATKNPFASGSSPSELVCGEFPQHGERVPVKVL